MAVRAAVVVVLVKTFEDVDVLDVVDGHGREAHTQTEFLQTGEFAISYNSSVNQSIKAIRSFVGNTHKTVVVRRVLNHAIAAIVRIVHREWNGATKVIVDEPQSRQIPESAQQLVTSLATQQQHLTSRL